MSISFSGLASGLDTSSWVESLVSLREAKIEGYEEEKSVIETTQETLSNIKSFFSSFRSMIEKVTDANFGIPSMDIFAQKLATSSDTSVLTAAAATEAEEGTYDVLVDKLATETQAVSGLNSTFTIIESQTAVVNSKLSSIGVKAGDIGVTVDGTKHTVTIGEDDTIGDFINKLQQIGVSANYNESTGIFSINLDSSAIDDTLTVQNDGTVGTGIIDALNLSETGGYESSELKLTNTQTITVTATGDTKLSELGGINAGQIQIDSNDASFTINIDEDMTLKELVEALQSKGIEAVLGKDGVLQITDAEIVDVGNTGVLDGLGMETDVNSKTQTSDGLSYETVVTTLTKADGSTKLNELEGWDNSTASFVVESSSGNLTTITVSGDTTLEQVVNKLKDAGISAVLNSNGVLTVSGGKISGDAADILGITSGSESTSKIYVNGNTLYTTRVDYANRYNTLEELGVDMTVPSGEKAFAVYDSKNQLVAELSFDEDTTLDEIFSELSAYGITGNISNGAISLYSSKGNFVRGSIVNQLGIADAAEVTMTGSVGGNYSITTPIDATTTFAEAGINAAGKSLKIWRCEDPFLVTTEDELQNLVDENGFYLDYDLITITSNEQTFQDLFDMLAGYGISASINNGHIYLTNSASYVSDSYNRYEVKDDFRFVTGSLAEELGIEASMGIVQQAFYVSVNVADYTQTIYSGLATESSKIADYVLKYSVTGNIGYLTVSYTGTDGTVVNERFNISQTMTFGELFDILEEYGINASITNGVITYECSEDFNLSYMSINSYSFAMTGGTGYRWTYRPSFTDIGLPVGNYSRTRYSTITTGMSTTSSYAVYDSSELIDENTKLTDIGMKAGEFNLIRTIGSLDGVESMHKMTITNSSTVGDLIDWINNEVSGITVSLSDGKLTLTGGSSSYISWLYGEFATIFSLNYGENITYQISEEQITYYAPPGTTQSEKLYKDEYVKNISVNDFTTLGELGLVNTGTVDLLYYNGTEESITVNSSTTLKEFNELLGDEITLKIDGDSLYMIVTPAVKITDMSESILNIFGEKMDLGDFRSQATSAVNSASKRLVVVTNGQSEDTSAYHTTYSNKTIGSLFVSGTGAAEGETTLAALNNGTGLTFDSSGSASLVINTLDKEGFARNTTINFSKTQTLNSVFDTLASYGINASVDGSGRIVVNSSSLSDFDISGTLGDYLLGDYVKNYDTKAAGLQKVETTTQTVGAGKDTLLSDLGVNPGEYYIYKDGVRYTALISSDETLGSFMDTLESFGIQTALMTGGSESKLVILGQGDSYISTSNSQASDVIGQLFGNSTPDVSLSYSTSGTVYKTVTSVQTATEDTLLSSFDTVWGSSSLKSAGNLVITTADGINRTVRITETDSIGSLLDKLENAGISAGFNNGKFYIYGGASINANGTTSSLINPNAGMQLVYKTNINGMMFSTDAVEETITIVEEHSSSAASYADLNTKLGTLGITGGTLSVYRNGQKLLLNIESDDTFSDLRSMISSKFSDLDLKFEDGYLVFYSKYDDISVEVGNTTDTSNFLAVTGLNKDDKTAKSARALYTVNSDSLVTADGIFRAGKVTAGSFTVGTAVINIDNSTRISDIVSQINNNEDTNATAYWDSIDGKLVIKSKTSGAALINIEAGTSNFTDIMGYTTSEWNIDGILKSSRMNVETQTLGSNAQFRINGTTYTSSSNTVTSDITRLTGVTLNLNGLTAGSSVKVTVEKDKESVATALSDVVDAYNELMKNVDEAIAGEGVLKNQTTLKMIRNQLRSLMTSSDTGATVFRNLDAIGISVDTASASNISTSNSSIISLSFNKEKFMDAYEADADAVKTLLLGGNDNKGVFTQVETLLENSLQSVSGYFAITEKSYQRQINNLNDKITKENNYIEKYKARLEKKFSSMDLLIGQMQQQYSSFLTF